MRVLFVMMILTSIAMGADLLPLVDPDTCNAYMLIARENGVEGASIGLDKIEDANYGGQYRIELKEDSKTPEYRSPNGRFPGYDEAIAGIIASNGQRLRFITLDSKRRRNFYLLPFETSHVVISVPTENEINSLNAVLQNSSFKVGAVPLSSNTIDREFHFDHDGNPVSKKGKFSVLIHRRKHSFAVTIRINHIAGFRNRNGISPDGVAVGILQEGKLHEIQYALPSFGSNPMPSTINPMKEVEFVVFGY